MEDYFIFDLETAPVKEGAEAEAALNPTTAEIVAAGIRHDGENYIFNESEEKDILTNFWHRWSLIRKGDSSIPGIGFNIKNFDLRFLTTRSLANEACVRPFIKKNMIDLREIVSCYNWGSEGTLEEFCKIADIEPPADSGQKVPMWYKNGDEDKIKEHLEEDLVKTEELFEKADLVNLTKVEKW